MSMTSHPNQKLIGGLALSLLLSACGGDDSGSKPGATPPAEKDPYGQAEEPAPADYTQELTLKFSPQVGDQPLSCTAENTLGSSSATAIMADARMYIHGVELKAEGGSWVTAHLVGDNKWQRTQVGLLDFEDKTGQCQQEGSTDTNTELKLKAPAGAYSGLRFKVGIPTALNHLNAATSPAPFNAEGMYWTWLTGYKFLRVDWMVQTGTTDDGKPTYARWNTHLGATKCPGEAPIKPPSAPCANPNLPAIELADFNPATDTVVFDAQALVATSDLKINMADTPPGCMSGPGDTDCAGVFPALGLNFATGQHQAGQTAFKVQKGS